MMVFRCKSIALIVKKKGRRKMVIDTEPKCIMCKNIGIRRVSVGGDPFCDYCWDRFCFTYTASHPSPKKEDQVHPSHYKELNPEPITVIENWKLDFYTGNALKYIARAGRKADAATDLKKAIWYLERKIKSLEDFNRSN